MKHFQKGSPQKGVFRLSKTYITKRVVRPTPINPQKAATCAWLFALLKGLGTSVGKYFLPGSTQPAKAKKGTGPASRWAARRQPLAKTRKSGLSHFFDTLKAPFGEPFLHLAGCLRSHTALPRWAGPMQKGKESMAVRPPDHRHSASLGQRPFFNLFRKEKPV